jgi:hypothetical protein
MAVGPKWKRRTGLFVALLAILLALTGNIATGNLPSSWSKWLWIAWPATGVLVAITLLVEHRRVIADERVVTAPADTQHGGTGSSIAMVMEAGRSHTSVEQPAERSGILYLTASPRGDLRVDKEFRGVVDAISRSHGRDDIAIEHAPAASFHDLVRRLGQFQPKILHFSGHGNEAMLLFEGSEPGGSPVSVEAFAAAIATAEEPPILVVLLAVRSAEFAKQSSMLGRINQRIRSSNFGSA